jgi:hypothetical protein
MAYGLRERVALVQFFTYTCIKRLWTLPYVRAWHELVDGQAPGRITESTCTSRATP